MRVWSSVMGALVVTTAIAEGCSHGTGVTPVCKTAGSATVSTSSAGGAGQAAGAGGAGGAGGATMTSAGGGTATSSVAATGAGTSCDPPVFCDRGNGEIKATPQCCGFRRNDEFGLQCGKPITTDDIDANTGASAAFSTNCPAMGAAPLFCPDKTANQQKSICDAAQKVYDACIKNK
jgi:hypothetical protein